MTKISEGQRFKRYIARIDKFMFNKKKEKKKRHWLQKNCLNHEN